MSEAGDEWRLAAFQNRIATSGLNVDVTARVYNPGSLRIDIGLDIAG
jgi:hypothetical protein